MVWGPPLCGARPALAALARVLLTRALVHQLVPAGVHHTNTETERPQSILPVRHVGLFPHGAGRRDSACQRRRVAAEPSQAIGSHGREARGWPRQVTPPVCPEQRWHPVTTWATSLSNRNCGKATPISRPMSLCGESEVVVNTSQRKPTSLRRCPSPSPASRAHSHCSR